MTTEISVMYRSEKVNAKYILTIALLEPYIEVNKILLNWVK